MPSLTYLSTLPHSIPTTSTWLSSARDLATAHPYISSGLGALAAWQIYQRIVKPGFSALSRTLCGSPNHTVDPALEQQVDDWEKRGGTSLGTTAPDCSKVDMGVIGRLLSCKRRSDVVSAGKTAIETLSHASKSERRTLLREARTAGRELLEDVDTHRPYERTHAWPYENLRVIGHLLGDGVQVTKRNGLQFSDGSLASTVQALSDLNTSLSPPYASAACNSDQKRCYRSQLRRTLHSCFGENMERIRTYERNGAAGCQTNTMQSARPAMVPKNPIKA